MGKWPKGNEFRYKTGHIPTNKKRKCVSPEKKDNKQQLYVRLTREMTNLVQNVPYKEDNITSETDCKPATLLRPETTKSKMDKNSKSSQEEQR